MRNMQRGSTALLAVIALFVFGSLLAVVFPFITNETKFSAKTHDSYEAQYAAEGGIKRAAVELLKSSGANWTWLDKDQNFTDSNEKYRLSLALKGKPGTKITPATPPVAATYLATCVGMVRGSSQTVTAEIVLEGPISDLNAFDYAVAANTATFSSEGKGAPVNPGTVSKPGMGRVVADGEVKGLDDPDQASYLSKDPKTKLQYPPFSRMAKFKDDSKPTITIESLGDNVKYNSETNTYSLVNNAKIENCTLIVNGNLHFESGSTNNANIIVHGDLTIEPAINYNGENLIVAKGKIDNKDNNSFQGIMVTYDDFNGPININNGCLVVVKNANFTGYPNINYSESIVHHVLKPGDGSTVDILNWHIN